ncbi:neto-1 [Cordylochernes scorpioides]|uniref:Neto-1 n=1 Tax=Cordylochernes scorpioides TaxID=51811 RepID=A0ABY6JVB5_9ARAC|nr:neto-1 [Cordylochernes scorpioides]
MSNETICQYFSAPDKEKMEFSSPNYPNEYPNNLNCTLKLEAPYGSFVRVEFRDIFDMENSVDCQFDYVEARDGQYGYSPVIRRVCGHRFPEQIHSRDRHLWLRFHSDDSLQYAGFRGIYEFTHGWNDALLSQMNIRFEKYVLFEPHNCEANYFEVYEERETGEDTLIQNFCGTKAVPVTISSNKAYIRFFAESSAIEKFQSDIKNPFGPDFRIIFTAMRPCELPLYFIFTTFASTLFMLMSLECNGVDNCNYKYDEEPENCKLDVGGYSNHMIIILIIFFVLVISMGASIGLSCVHKVRQRKERVRDYKERRSKERSLEAGTDHRIVPSRSTLEMQATLAAQAAQEAARRHSQRLADAEEKNEEPKPNGGTEPTRTKPPPPPPNSKPPPNPKPPGILLRGPPPYGWNLPPTSETAGSTSQPRLDTRRHSTPSRPGSQVIADR